MKKLISLLLALSFLFAAAPAMAQEVSLPLLDTINDAPFVQSGDSSENEIYYAYDPADADDLEYFLTLCAITGVYSYPYSIDETQQTYLLLKPGTDFAAIISYSIENGFMTVSAPRDCPATDEETLSAAIDYFLQDVALPSGNGANVMPQFYASVNSMIVSSGTFGLNGIFDGELAWTEYYKNISFAQMDKYISEMMLCGFDVTITDFACGDDGVIDNCLYILDNGDAQIIVLYTDDYVSVHYKPGVSYYLLSGEEYAQYIPQR